MERKLVISGSKEKELDHLTGRANKGFVSKKLKFPDRRLLDEVTFAIETALDQENCLGGLLIIGSVANMEEKRYGDVDLVVTLGNPEKDSRLVVSVLQKNLQKLPRLKAGVKNMFVPSPNGGELVTTFYLQRQYTIGKINLPFKNLINSSVFEIHVCAPFEYPHKDYLRWLSKERKAYCLWFEKD